MKTRLEIEVLEPRPARKKNPIGTWEHRPISDADKKRLAGRRRPQQLTVRVGKGLYHFARRSAWEKGMTVADWLRSVLTRKWRKACSNSASRRPRKR